MGNDLSNGAYTTNNIETVTIVAGPQIANITSDALGARSVVVLHFVLTASTSTRVFHVVVPDGVPTEL